jgi:hypothetical protein
MVPTIEIVVNSRRRKYWTIFLGYQGKLIMVLTSAVRLGWLLQKKIFCNSIKQVSLVSSADVITIVFWPFWSSCMHKCILLLEFTMISMVPTRHRRRKKVFIILSAEEPACYELRQTEPIPSLLLWKRNHAEGCWREVPPNLITAKFRQ